MTPRPNEGTGNTLAAPMRHPLMMHVPGGGPQSSNAQQLATQQQPVSGGFFRGVLRLVSQLIFSIISLFKEE